MQNVNSTLANQVVWFIESHSSEALTLNYIADMVGVSPYHLVRAFGVATGYSVMRYLRVRRLSNAAKTLADGRHANILDVALEAGYGSHEAFTRAFREQFGITPETIRLQGHVDNIDLVEAVKMNNDIHQTIEAPRLETHDAFLVIGLRRRYGQEASSQIPAQWQEFAPYIGTIPDQIGANTYGVGYNSDDQGHIDYLCGVEVSGFAELPEKFDGVRIPQQNYAVFSHRDHVSTVNRTWDVIWGQWLPQSEYAAADAPFFERYGENFDPTSGLGGFELWVPIK